MARRKTDSTLSSAREAIYRKVQHDEDACALLLASDWLTDQFPFAVHVWTKYWPPDLPTRSAYSLFSDFLAWAAHPDVCPTVSPLLEAVLVARAHKQMGHQFEKRSLLLCTRLHPSAICKPVFLAQLPHLVCKKLAEPYPPPNLYACETAEIFARNAAFIYDKQPSDARKPHKFATDIDPSLLVHDLGREQSALFVDEQGALVAVVIREACRDAGVVSFVDNSIEETVQTHTNIRVRAVLLIQISRTTNSEQKENMGHMSQMGLSAGSLNKLMLGWVRNIRVRKKNHIEHQAVNRNASSAFAVLWSLARTLLPEEIINDYLDFIQTLGIHQMDADGEMDPDCNGYGVYHVSVDGKVFEFHDAELAPPAGVMAENYCRCGCTPLQAIGTLKVQFADTSILNTNLTTGLYHGLHPESTTLVLPVLKLVGTSFYHHMVFASKQLQTRLLPGTPGIGMVRASSWLTQVTTRRSTTSEAWPLLHQIDF